MAVVTGIIHSTAFKFNGNNVIGFMVMCTSGLIVNYFALYFCHMSRKPKVTILTFPYNTINAHKSMSQTIDIRKFGVKNLPLQPYKNRYTFGH
jgi:hypothetical protein